MKTKLTLLASTTLAALAIAAPAQAGSGWYANISGGANWLSDDGFAVATVTDTLIFSPDSDTGFIVSGAIGYSLNNVMQGLRAEVEVAYRENQVDGLWFSDNVAGVGGLDSGALDYDHSTVSVMANVWYDFNVGAVTPYVGGGIGWADTDLDGTYAGGDNTVLAFSDNGFAWQLGAGVNFDISPNMKLGVGYRYFEGPEVAVIAPGTGNTIGSDVESQNHSALVALTFGM